MREACTDAGWRRRRSAPWMYPFALHRRLDFEGREAAVGPRNAGVDRVVMPAFLPSVSIDKLLMYIWNSCWPKICK